MRRRPYPDEVRNRRFTTTIGSVLQQRRGKPMNSRPAEARFRHCKPAATIFGVLFFSTVGYIALHYGPNAPPRGVRLVVLVVGMVSLVGLSFSLVLLFMDRILELARARQGGTAAVPTRRGRRKRS